MKITSKGTNGKFRVGDTFLVIIDALIEGRNGYGEFTDYILNAVPPPHREEIHPADGCVVTEGFLEQCFLFSTVSGFNKAEIIETERLQPCPFCGCDMHLRAETMIDGRTIRFVPQGYHKHGCQLQFASSHIGGCTTADGAVKKWNRRYIAKTQKVRAHKSRSKTGFECTACYNDADEDAVYCKHCGVKFEE